MGPGHYVVFHWEKRERLKKDAYYGEKKDKLKVEHGAANTTINSLKCMSFF